MLEVVVDSRIRIEARGLPKVCLDAITEDFTHSNPEHGSKQAMGFPVWSIPREIVMWRRERSGGFSVPRGGMARVRRRLEEHKINWSEVDNRTEGTPCRFPRYVGFPMRPYQEDAIAAALEREQCIIRAGTGCGKTEMALALLARIGLNAIVILPTGGLFKQWQDRIAATFKVKGNALGIVQGKTRRLRPITIAMQQTLAQGVDEEICEFFGAIVVEECHLAAARTFVEVVDQFPARYRIAISADHTRKDKKHFLVHDLFSDVAYEIGRRELEAQGHILGVQIRVVPTDFRADWYGVRDEDDKNDEREIDFNRLLDEMTDDPARNALALRFMDEEIAAGEQAIMLSARRDHVRALDRHFVRRWIPTGFLLGKQEAGDDVEFDRTRAGLVSGKVRVGIGTYKALGFGIDLPAVAVGCAVTPIAGNNQVFNQVRGRLCRPNPKAGKSQGRLYVLWDRHVYPGHLKKICAKNENVVVWNGTRWVPAAKYQARAKRKSEWAARRTG